jgi:hypothetical protein
MRLDSFLNVSLSYSLFCHPEFGYSFSNGVNLKGKKRRVAIAESCFHFLSYLLLLYLTMLLITENIARKMVNNALGKNVKEKAVA